MEVFASIGFLLIPVRDTWGYETKMSCASRFSPPKP